LPSPTVTIIIATYNWSAALRCSIPSVLAQSFTDWELLVIGDACTDDSPAVVASFADPRISWHNTPTRFTSQSGPNNLGLQLARGQFIAYLGHDDLWHPDHLAHLLKAIQNADLAAGITAMYGPPGSGVRVLSGLFAEGIWQPTDFLVPSGILHRPGLGPWPLPAETDVPVDAGFLRQAIQSGARIVSSHRLTVFKFNSAWRRDSYRHRDTSEQQALLARLQADPAATTEIELIGLLRAHRELRLHHAAMPTPGPRNFQPFRGLAQPSPEPLSDPRRFLPQDDFAGLEWHALEHHPELGLLRWSGPSPTASLVLPVSAAGPYVLRLQLLNVFAADLAAALTLRLNGVPTPFTISSSALLTAHGPAASPVQIELHCARLFNPFLASDGQNPDQRWLGVCLQSVELDLV